MPTVTSKRDIAAPVEQVFRTIADIENFAEAIPDIVNIEILSEAKTGVGARFRETRVMKGREAKSVLEVTEYRENDMVRFVSDEGGAVWDSVFETAPDAGGGAILTLRMEARPHSIMAHIMTPLIMGMVRKAVEGDMDAVKAWCERRAA
ncbi:MAG: SRPBCC family protein [Pseudomonadota bacterium]